MKKYLFLSLASLLLFVASAYWGITTHNIGSIIQESNVTLGLLQRLQLDYWWIPAFVFFALTTFFLIMYRKSRNGR